MKSSPIWKDAALKLISLFSLAAFSFSALATSMPPTFSLMYQSEATSANTLSPGVLKPFSILEFLNAEVGTSLRFSDAGLEIWEYKGEIAYHLSEAFALSARLSRQTQFNHATAHTALTGFFTARSPRLAGFEFWASVGWYKRYSDLARATVFPIVWGDYSTHDFATAFGASWSAESWSLAFRVATVDEWETYNLNHPFMEARVELTDLGGMRVAAFGRYQLALGFGRLDRFVSGVFFTVPLAADTPPATR